MSFDISSSAPLLARDVLATLDRLAPLTWTEKVYPGDNVGFLLGFESAPVSRLLCALDISLQTIQEASRLNAQLIVSHHPLTFGLTSITDQTPTGRHILSLISHQISAICMHSNWDAAPQGVNDALAEALGLSGPFTFLDSSYTHTDGRVYGLGRIGFLEQPVPSHDFALSVKTTLNCKGVRAVCGSRPISRVAVCSGSGASLWDAAVRQNCDAYVTGDVKHHMFIEAHAMDITLIDAGHFPTENISMYRLAAALQSAHPELTVHLSQIKSEPADWL